MRSVAAYGAKHDGDETELQADVNRFEIGHLALVVSTSAPVGEAGDTEDISGFAAM